MTSSSGIFHRSLLTGLTLAAFLPVALAEKTPGWVESCGASTTFPEAKYVTGFGVGQDAKTEDRVIVARDRAFADLSARLLTDIQSKILSSEREVDKRITSDFSSTIHAFTQLRILGAEVQRWNDDKNRITYALAVLNKQQAASNYVVRTQELQSRITDLFGEADRAEKQGHLKDALTRYRKAMPLLVEFGESRTIATLLGASIPNQTAAQSLSAIQAKIDRMLKDPVTTIHGAAVAISEQLAAQVTTNRPVAVFPLIFKDTDFTSEFGGYFRDQLEQGLPPSFTVQNSTVTVSRTTEPPLTLTGNYWLKGADVEVSVSLSDPQNGIKTGFASVVFPSNLLSAASVDPTPKGYEHAAELYKRLATNAVPSGLSLEAWTSKGKKYLLFHEKEELQLHVRVSKPCFLKAVNAMSTGVECLLFENLWVDMEKVNRDYQLPETYVAAPPFGVERIVLYARTTKFDKESVVTKVYEGESYNNVLSKSIAELTTITRGWHPKTDAPAEQTDACITLTTMK